MRRGPTVAADSGSKYASRIAPRLQRYSVLA